MKTQVPVQNLVDATPEEIKAWDEKTKSLMDKYEAAVRAKADEIAEQKATEKRKELINEGIDIAKNMVVPVLTSLAGLIGAVVALRAGSKPSLQPRTAEAAPAGSDQTG